MGCRDCDRCTETFFTKFVMVLPRLCYTLLTFWNVKMFQRFCPECGHRVKWHKRLKDGRFAD